MADRGGRRHGGRLASRLAVNAVMIAGAAAMILPFLWMISASFKPEVDIFEFPIHWIPRRPTTDHHVQVWREMRFAMYYLNSVKITSIGVFLEVVTSLLAAYGFSRVRWPGRDVLFGLYVSTLMIPYAVIMIPQYKLLREVGLTNTHLGLLVLYAFTAFGTFLMRQFFMQIPEELSESARIDGAGELCIFARIITPLAGAGVAALVILRFVDIWNDFLGPLIYLTDHHLKTIPRALADFRVDMQMQERYGMVMAAAVASLVPIVAVYFAAQKYIIEGIARAGIKG